jgi:hypothetical protein
MAMRRSLGTRGNFDVCASGSVFAHSGLAAHFQGIPKEGDLEY